MKPKYEELMKILEQVLLIQDGCIHCKHRLPHDDCDLNWCKNRESYEIDFEKVNKDYELNGNLDCL